MGPQLDSCGRVDLSGKKLLDDMLQWGRNLIVAEGLSLSDRLSSRARLQWGRNLIVAEGCRKAFCSRKAISFNGAAT